MILKEFDKGNIAISEEFAIKDINAAAGSKALKDFIPFYNSTLIEKLAIDNIKYITKVNEFNFPKDMISNASFVNGKVDLSIQSDNGISTSIFSKKEDVIGFTPTYGSISRFGLYSAFPSFERISFFSKDINLIKDTFNKVKGTDKNDMTTITLDDAILVNDDMKIYEGSINKDITNNIKAAYNIIISAESTSSLSNINGISVGKRISNKNIEDLIKDFRTENLTYNTKLHLSLGAYYLTGENREKYYITAAKFRTFIKEEVNKIFKEYDLIKLENTEENSLISAFLGLPIAYTKDYLIIGNVKEDYKVLSYIKENL